MATPLQNFARAAALGRNPEEPSRTSTAAQIANNVLAPIAMIGNVFDMPASSGRDLLSAVGSGDWNRYNPLDQWLTPWHKDAGNRARGYDVNQHLFGAKPNDPTKWEWNDLGSFATEVLTDPLAWGSGGMSALAKGPGSVARASGLANNLTRVQRMEKTGRQLLEEYAAKYPKRASKMLDEYSQAANKQGYKFNDIIDQPVGNWIRLHGPFGIGSFGGINNKFLAGALDSMQKRIGDSKIGEALGWAFNHKLKGRWGKVKQSAFRRLYDRLDEVSGDHHEAAVGVTQMFDDVGKVFEADNASLFAAGGPKRGTSATGIYDKIMRDALEAHGTKRNYRQALLDQAKEHGVTLSPQMLDEAEDAMRTFRKVSDAEYADLLDMGLKGRFNPDTEHHSWFARRMGEAYAKAANKGDIYDNSILSTSSTRGRRKALMGVSAKTIRKIREGWTDKFGTHHPDYYLDPKDGWKRILRDFKDVEGGYKYTYKKVDPVTGAETTIRDTATPKYHAKSLVKRLQKARDVPVFEGTVIDDMFNNLRNQPRVGETLRAVHEFVGENLSFTGDMTVSKMFNDLGLNRLQAVDFLDRELKRLGRPVSNVGSMKVSNEVFEALKDLLGRGPAKKRDEGLEAILKPWDKATKVFKENWTLPWIPFHARNRAGGIINNLIGGPLQNPLEAADYLRTEAQESLGKWGKGAPRYQSEREGDMLKMMSQGMFGEPGNPLGSSDVDLPAAALHGNPVTDLLTGTSWREGAKRAAENPWQTHSVLGQMGVPIVGQNTPYIGPVIGKVNQAHKTLLDAGEKSAGMVEFHNRANLFKYLTEKKGYSPNQARREVENTQFNYGAVSPLEQHFMKRVFPFWGFMRNQTRLTADMLGSKPGGAGAQMIRAQTQARDPEDVLPADIANTMALQLGEQPDGGKRYLTGFGNPIEAAAGNLTMPLDFEGGLLDLAAASHPFIKFPAELATGQTFFQRGTEGGGRPLKDLDPTLGRMFGTFQGSDQPVRDWAGTPGLTQFVEHAVQNTPLSKYLTTARTVADPRKSGLSLAQNLLTPAKITDVSPDRQERLLQSASNSIADELGAGTWTNRYFRQEDIARAEKTNPELAERMKALNALWTESKRKASKKRQEKEKAKKEGQPPVATANPILRLLGM